LVPDPARHLSEKVEEETVHNPHRTFDHPIRRLRGLIYVDTAGTLRTVDSRFVSPVRHGLDIGLAYDWSTLVAEFFPPIRKIVIDCQKQGDLQKLEHDPDKWTPVFQKNHAPPKYLGMIRFNLIGSWSRKRR
jgi:hypothetical protein